ncbi:hypothetical protein [Sphingobium sp.]|uniref:hypothetical protein n=1 Tax=Sphingobium sp. TaxID=1912891 RepID=UPI0028BE566C|nr:hypothetical protein [Sphingobium sp.]
MVDAERLDSAFLESGGDYAPFHRLHALRVDLEGRKFPDACLTKLAGQAAVDAGEAVAALIELSAVTSPCAVRNAREKTENAIGTFTSGLAALDRGKKGDQA